MGCPCRKARRNGVIQLTMDETGGVARLEEKHMIAILVYLATHGPSRKIDIYDGVSSNPRMPDKLNALEEMGLISQDVDSVTRSTVVSLTGAGENAARLLVTIDNIIRGRVKPRAD